MQNCQHQTKLYRLYAPKTYHMNHQLNHQYILKSPL